MNTLRVRGALGCAAAFFALVSVAAGGAHATTLAEDDFILSFPSYADGGSGFAGPWEPGGFNASAARYRTGGDSLCAPALQCCLGSSVSARAQPVINGMVRDLAVSLGAAPQTVYFSFLLEPRGTLQEGAFNGFFGLTFGNMTELFVGKSGGGTEYVLETRGGGGQVSSGVPVVVGRTALLVVKAELQPGADVFTLYVNPTPLAEEPDEGALKTDLDVGVVSRIGVYSTGAFAIDEIRIGTSYEDVVRVASRGPKAMCQAP